MIGDKTLEKAQKGDPTAVEKVCSATREPLYRFVYFKVQNRALIVNALNGLTEEQRNIVILRIIEGYSVAVKVSGRLRPER